MRTKLVNLTLAGLVASSLVLGGSRPAAAETAEVVPETVRQAFQEASPPQRYAALEVLRTKYPDLRLELRRHLESAYPRFSTRAPRAVLGLQEKYPGLLWSLPKQLVADLGGEPAEALRDVGRAALERYPDLPARMAEIRREHAPRRAVREVIATRFPGFRTDVVSTLRRGHAAELARARAEAASVMAGEHPEVRLAVAEEISRFADEHPEATAEMREALRRGERPLQKVAFGHPGLMLDLADRVAQAHGPAIRQAAVDVLTRLEKVAPELPGSVARSLLTLVEERYPELPGAVSEARVQARRAMRDAVAAEFPDLGPTVARTMAERHPDLLTKVRTSVKTRYPQLREDVHQALEAEFPGLHAEVRSFLDTRYPHVFTDVEAALRS